MNTGNKNNNSTGLNWKLVNFCEFDKYAIKSYCEIHGEDESKNLGDITTVDETKLDDFDLMTWGFPCTDISVAGNQKGFIDENGEKTRSGMYYEGIRILKYKKPKISIIENVKNLTGKRFKKEFETILNDLDDAGYNSYYKVLNAKDYGVPQNRERVFIISVRKDVDNGKFKFPEPFDNGIRLKDILEDEVDEKFYISNDKVKRFLEDLKIDKAKEVSHLSGIIKIGQINSSQDGVIVSSNGIAPTHTSGHGNTPKVIEIAKTGNHQKDGIYSENGISPTLLSTSYKQPIQVGVEKVGNINPSGKGMNGNVFNENGLAPTVTTNKGEGNKILQVAQIYPNSGNPQAGRIYDANGISPSMDTCSGGNRMPKVLELINSEIDGTSRTIKAQYYKTSLANYKRTGDMGATGVTNGFAIRKLTPKECFRLMGFSDKDFEAAKKAGISNSQLYKQAGNSIVVDVLYYIYIELYKAMPYLFEELKLGSFFSGIGAFESALDRFYENVNSMKEPKIEEAREIILKYKDNPVEYLEKELGVKLTTAQKHFFNFYYGLKEVRDEM